MTIPLLHDGLPVTTAANINDAVAAAYADSVGKTYEICNTRVASYSALRALSPVNTSSIYLDGGASIGDGAQGVFRGVTGAAAGTYVDNGSTIIVPTGGDGSAAWLRVNSNSLYENFILSFAGAVSRTVAAKLQEVVSVLDFGADNTGVIDSSTAFQTAINDLPAEGGTILVPSGSYLINTAPTSGAKSIFWDLSPGATFSGAGVTPGGFPYLTTNLGQMAVGPFIQSRTTRVGGSLTNGGVQAFGVEMIQPSSVTTDQSVALYAGASGSSHSTSANVWAINSLISAESGAAGTYQNLELDVNNFSSSALVKGISINGVGTANPAVGLEVMRTGTGAGSDWVTGIDIRNALTGLQIPNNDGNLANGIEIGGPSLSSSADIFAKQLTNGGDGILFQRNTDISPTGYILRAVNAANSANIFLLDAIGNMTTSGNMSAANITSNGQLVLSTYDTKGGQTPVSITVGASPFAYTATYGGSVAVSGGTVSQVTLTRGGIVVYTSTLSANDLPVRAGDIVTVTYTAAPTMYQISD